MDLYQLSRMSRQQLINYIKSKDVRYVPQLAMATGRELRQIAWRLAKGDVG